MRNIFKDFWQETRITLSCFQNCTQRVEKEFERTYLRFFLFLSRVSELDTSSEEKIFKEKYIAWVKSLYLPFYVSLTELHLRVQRNVSFRSTLLEFFHQFMILRRTLLDLVKLFWTSFSKMPSMSPQDLLKVCFFSGKTTDLLIILDLWAKTFGFFIKFFQQNCENGILRVQMKK